MPPSRMIRAIVTAFGVAAGAGAAQLGIGYGLGVFSWLPTVQGADEAAWLASLAWTVWISATAVIIGAVVGDRAGLANVRLSSLAQVLVRATVVLSAALGGLIVVALAAVPARAAQREDTFAPQMIVGGYAVAGVIIGLLIAFAAVNARAIASNLLVTTGWMWLLAAVATMDDLAADRHTHGSQLGAWQVTAAGPVFHGVYMPGATMAAASALVIGALAAWPAAMRGANKVGVLLSGAAGPATVALAYLLVTPEKSEYAYAVLAGFVGSVLVALLSGSRRRAGRGRLASTGAGSADDNKPGSIGAAEPKVAGDPV